MTTSSESGSPVGGAVFRSGNFNRLFAARFITAFGTAMAPIAMAFAVLDLTGSPRLVGIVIASQTLPQVLVQLFGGALADRGSRKRMMVMADALAAASQTMMAMLLLGGGAQIWQLCALMAVNGLAFALYGPASVGLVPQVAERDSLQSANAMLGLSQSGAMSLGGVTAGLIVATAGAGWAIAVDAATFAVSGIIVLGIHPRPQQHSESQSLLRDLRDGWREFTAHRWLWTIVLKFSILMAAWSGGFLVVGPVVAKSSLGGPVAWGWISGAMGAGLLAGAVIGMRLSVQRPMWVATLCVFSFAAPLLLLIAPAPVWAIAAGAFLAGLCGQIFGVLWYTTLHTRVAPEALSRVSAYDHMGSIALMPLGEAAAGPLVVAIGAPATLWLASAAIVIPTAAVLCVREVRTLGLPDAASSGPARPT